MPPRLSWVGGDPLPAVELLAALLLLVRPVSVAGAAIALLLLFVFFAGVSHALRRGAAPDCHCFGQLCSEPAGLSTLVRNALLAGLANTDRAPGAGPIAFWRRLVVWRGGQIGLVATGALAWLPFPCAAMA